MPLSKPNSEPGPGENWGNKPSGVTRMSRNHGEQMRVRKEFYLSVASLGFVACVVWGIAGLKVLYGPQLRLEEQATLRHNATVTSVAFSPDGKTLAAASNDRTIKLWDVASGANTLTIQGHTDYVTSLLFSGDGQSLA